MLDTKILNDLKKIPKVLLLFGKETLLLEEFLSLLLEKLVVNDLDRYNLDIRSAMNVDLETVVNIANSYPMMGEKRVVVIKDFEMYFEKKTKSKKGKTDSNDLFAKYIEKPQETTYLVCVGAPKSYLGISSFSNNSDKYKKIEKSLVFPYTKLIQDGSYIEFNQLTGEKLTHWVKNRFLAKEYEVSTKVAELLIIQNNNNLADIANEIEKILLFMYNKDIREVSLEVFNDISGNNSEFNVFDLQNKVLEANLKDSLFYLYVLQKNNKNGLLIVNILSKLFISLLKLTEIRFEGDKFVNASIVGVSPYFYDKYVSALKHFNEETIILAINLLAEIDYKLKSSSENETYLLEKFLLEILK